MVALFVVGTILLFVLAEAIVAYLRKPEPQPLRKPVLVPNGMPAGLFVDARHAWVSLEADGKVRVGLDELARKILGTLDGVRFVEPGTRVARGDTLLWAKVGDVEIPVGSPVTGTIEATQEPPGGAKGTDPAAWFVALRPERLGFEIRALRVAEEASAWMRAECRRLTETLHGLRASTANALPDGGEPVDGFIRHLDDASRRQILKGFLVREP